MDFDENKVKEFIKSNFKFDRYTGVGSRDRPKEIGELIEQIAYSLNKYGGLALWTGDASGCDTDFTKGHKQYSENNILALGKKDCTPEAQEITKSVLAPEHWANCNEHARKLLGRNSHQVLGRDLKSPTSRVICWTPEGKPIGGTQVAIRLAWKYEIAVDNLFFKHVQDFYRKGLMLDIFPF